jgi:hypothetical protein
MLLHNNNDLEELAIYCVEVLKENVKTDRRLAASLLITILEHHKDLITLVDK